MFRIPLNEAEWAQLDQEDQFDCLCDWFEQALRAGESPSAKAYSELIDMARRSALLKELMLIEQHCTQPRRATIAATSASTVSMRLGPADTDFELFHRKVASELDHKESSHQFPIPFGKYVLRSLIGRGAFGDVYLAEQIETGAMRAIKVPRAKLLADERDVLLFHREARNAGKLNHDHIVRVLDHGRFGSTPFLVSEYIPGKNLKDYLAGSNRLAPRTIAFLMSDLAKAIHHAHSKGIIHRDIKPSNVLIESRSDEVAVATLETRLNPKLLDFGISKVVSSNTLATLPGEILGTPAYMSPEQARGASSEVTSVSDVYSLGSMLYELLCGHPPFSGDASAITKKISSEEVPPLMKLDKNTNIDLATIAHKALRLDPKDRYASAFEFAKELDRWLDGEPILSRPITRWERAWLTMKRYPQEVALKVAASLLIVCAIVLGWLLWSARTSSITPLVTQGAITQPNANASALREWLKALPDSLEAPQPLWKLLNDEISAITFRQIGRALTPYVAAEPVLVQRLRAAEAEGKIEQQHLIACLLGYVKPTATPHTRSSAELIDWLIRSKFPRDEVGWSDVGFDLRDLLLPQAIQRYATSLTPGERASSLRFLHHLVDHERCEAVVAALGFSRLDELKQWKAELDPYRDQALQAIHTELDRLGCEFPHDPDGEDTAKRQSNLVLAAYMLGNTDFLWPSLAAVRDPRPRTYFVQRFGQLEAALEPLIARLEIESDPNVLFGILLTLETIAPKLQKIESFENLKAWVTKAYCSHPHGGIHTACHGLLRDWNQTAVVDSIDEQLKSEGIVNGRDWYLNSLGMTMHIFRGPKKHRVPVGTVGKDFASHNLWWEIEIPYSFAMASEELSVAHYLQFQSDFEVPKILRDSYPNASLKELPATGLVWRDAARFTQWLSDREGLTAAIRFTDEENNEIDLREEGYRLPTRNEWHVAVRGGSELEFIDRTHWTTFDGTSTSQENALQPIELLPSGSPNLLGVRGGNARPSEWTIQRFLPSSNRPVTDPELVLCRTRSANIHCGIFQNKSEQNQFYPSEQFRVANSGSPYLGMRVVRTLK